MRVDEQPIVVEQTFDCSVSELWNALTDINEMLEWYFDNIPDFRAVVGFHVEFDVDAAGRVFPHVWDVTEVIQEEKLVYGWRFGGYKGHSVTSFELSGDDQASSVRLTCTTLEDFDDDIEEFKRESGLAGWTYFLEQQLKTYLDNKSG